MKPPAQDPQLWSPKAPTVCACTGSYRPQLDAQGKLVKKREPAWRMMEQTRDLGCLQERHRFLAKQYHLDYQHHKNSKGSDGGYPDVHLWTDLRPDGGGSVYIELKRMGEDPTDVQREVMAGLQNAGHLVYLTRPCCLLVGVVDEIMAALAGVRCRYIEGNRDGPAFPIPPAPERDPGRAGTHAEPAAGPASRRCVTFRPPPPPGRDPEPFTPAVGVIVPAPSGTIGHTAMLELEQWLRRCGFSPADLPYPIRLVVGPGRLHAHCRLGLARPGADVRVWREGTPAGEFPDHLVDALHAIVFGGPSSEKVAELISAAAPAATP